MHDFPSEQCWRGQTSNSGKTQFCEYDRFKMTAKITKKINDTLLAIFIQLSENNNARLPVYF